MVIIVKKLNKFKKFIGILMLILLIVIIIYSLIFVLPGKKEIIKEENEINGYTLYERDIDVYKDIFNSLKDETDAKNYATKIAELYIIDLYTLSNKTGKNDITASQYVYESGRDNFKLKVSNTLYKYIGYTKELPTVKSINLVEVNENSYKIGDNEYNSYEVSLNWEYTKDYEYDKEAIVKVVKIDDKYYVVES